MRKKTLAGRKGTAQESLQPMALRPVVDDTLSPQTRAPAYRVGELYSRELRASVCLLKHVERVDAHCRGDAVCEALGMHALRSACAPPDRPVALALEIPRAVLGDARREYAADVRESAAAAKARADTERSIDGRPYATWSVQYDEAPARLVVAAPSLERYALDPHWATIRRG